MDDLTMDDCPRDRLVCIAHWHNDPAVNHKRRGIGWRGMVQKSFCAEHRLAGVVAEPLNVPRSGESCSIRPHNKMWIRIWRKLIAESIYKFTNLASDFCRQDWRREWVAFVADSPDCELTSANRPGFERKNWEGKKYYESGRQFFLLRFAMYLYQPFWVAPAPGEKGWTKVFVLPDVKNLTLFLAYYPTILQVGRSQEVSPLKDKDREDQPVEGIVSFAGESPYVMIHTFRHLPTEVLEQAGINGDLLETDMLYGAEVFTYKQQGNQQSIAECLRVDISQRSQDVANRILLMRKSLKNYALRHLLIHNCLVGQSWKTGIIECIVKAFTGK